MDKKLVIVESPAKAKTIGKILGSGYIVKSSVGHIRDLPERTLGVDIENGFLPKYVLSKGKSKVVTELKKAARGSSEIFLAPDPDREGEAIAWHLQEILAEAARGKPVHRVQYNEITPRAVRAAFEHPGTIDMQRVNAQQARRVLDRIVGYMVSPMLWRRLKKGLSAGRVQSVALRLVAERERQIQAFEVEEYWVLGAKVRRTTAPLDPFNVRLVKVDGEKPQIGSEEAAQKILAHLQGCAMRVADVRERQTARRPLPPFITSTLQQAASSVCGFSPNRTMSLAQKLYEGIELGGSSIGLITYMRTDSVSVAADARSAAQSFIVDNYGAQYYPEKPNFYKSRTSAQEAHEAIRPTDVTRTPESLKGILDAPSLRLYELIWKRFVASQMAAARINQRSVEIEPQLAADRSTYGAVCQFRASASEVIFDGFLKVMALDVRKKKRSDDEESEESDEVENLPPLIVGDQLTVLDWLSERKETKPPPRYSEASLIQALEANGVGRPSTYASIIETLTARNYTTRQKRLLIPTPLGLDVNDLLTDKLNHLFEPGFTARMEENLDLVEERGLEWTTMLGDFYSQFEKWMEQTREPPADTAKATAVLAMLEQVSEWGPEVKRGKRTYSDQRFVTSVRQQLVGGVKPLTDRQLLALVRLALRYHEQIDSAMEQLSALGFGDEIREELNAPDNSQAKFCFETLTKVELSENQTNFVESLRQHMESGRRLSERQVAALERIVAENAAQIDNFEDIVKKLNLSLEVALQPPDTETPLLLKMLHQITVWQEPIKRGRRIFDDQEFLSSVDDQFRRRNSLSPRQRQAMKRMASRYRAQIANYAELAAKLGMDKFDEKGEKGEKSEKRSEG